MYYMDNCLMFNASRDKFMMSIITYRRILRLRRMGRSTIIL